VLAFEKEEHNPEPRVTPAKAPLGPNPNDTNDDEERTGVEGQGQQTAMNWLLVREAQAVDRSLREVPREIE